MTLHDYERKIGLFYGFFSDFGLKDTFQERIAPKSLEIDRDSLQQGKSGNVINTDLRNTQHQPKA